MSDNSDDDLCAVAAAACTIVIAVESSREPVLKIQVPVQVPVLCMQVQVDR